MLKRLAPNLAYRLIKRGASTNKQTLNKKTKQQLTPIVQQLVDLLEPLFQFVVVQLNCVERKTFKQSTISDSNTLCSIEEGEKNKILQKQVTTMKNYKTINLFSISEEFKQWSKQSLIAFKNKLVALFSKSMKLYLFIYKKTSF